MTYLLTDAQRANFLQIMQNNQHDPDWVLFDPLLHPAPKGETLLLINEGGVLIQGSWYPGALAWGRKPRIPQSVKDRQNKRLAGVSIA